ncbi:uncharacterized protein TNCV_569631 [Trichonephila clavipes]|nr:uncharacterized protein TNCV_569631 [Trichonephila clavipes]
MVFWGYPCVPFSPRFSRIEENGAQGIPLCSFWLMLHCRRVAEVSPLLSIGWWYLSSVSLKRHCCRVSVADQGWWVYLLDPRPDAVHYILGVLRVSAVPCICQMTGTLPPLLDSGGWRHARMKLWVKV